MTSHAVGVDVGGTKIAAALVSDAGEVGPIVTVRTPASSGPAAVLDAIADAVRQVADGRPIVGVGVGTAGAVNASTGTIVSSTDTFTDWVGTEVAARLRERLGVVLVEVRNDVDAHAVGEAWLGSGSGVGSLMMVAVGTGVGGALVLDGRLRTGAHHLSGEIAHVPAVGAEGLRCTCGRLGHLEALASGPGLARHYVALSQRGSTTHGPQRDVAAPATGPGAPETPRGVLDVGEAVDAREVARRASVGDELARQAIADAASCLGRVVAGLVTVIDPDLVVIGGGVVGIGPAWWKPFETSCRSELVDALAGVRLRPAALGAEAALIGAAKSVLDVALHPRPRAPGT